MVDFYTLPGTPSDVLTSEQVGTRRIATEDRDTCFYEGRQGFAFYEFDIAGNQNAVIKVVSPVDTLVKKFAVNLLSSKMRVELVVGGTESGLFDTEIPARPVNSMSDVGDYTLGVSFDTGGSHTGGDVVDLLLLDATLQGNRTQTATATEDAPFGFAAGTFYIRLSNTDNSTAQGIFRARWEERP